MAVAPGGRAAMTRAPAGKAAVRGEGAPFIVAGARAPVATLARAPIIGR